MIEGEGHPGVAGLEVVGAGLHAGRIGGHRG